MKKYFDKYIKMFYDTRVSMFYFFNYKIMDNKILENSKKEVVEKPSQNSSSINTAKKKLTNLMTSVALASTLTLNPASATDKVSNSATTVSDGDIDKSNKLAEIEQNINNIKNKIHIIENKNDLNEEDFDKLDKLQNEIEILDKERDDIKLTIDNQLDKKLVIVDDRIKNKKEYGTQLDKEAKQKDEVIKAKLNNII